MSIATTAKILMSICLAISFITTVLRFWSRSTNLGKWLTWSAIDMMIIMSLSFQVALFAVGMLIFKAPPEDVPYVEKFFFAGSFLYFAELWSIKFSINLFHLRLTRRLGTVYRIAHYCLYFLVITFIIVVFLTIFDCIPVSDHFTGKCNPNVKSPVFWFPAAINIITDFILCIIPLPALMTINEKRIRITISFVFCLAGSVVLVSLVRVVLISRNPGKNGSWIIILSHIEVTAGLVISAIPDFSKYFTRKYLQSNGTGDYANTGGVSGNRSTLRTAHNRGNGVLDSIASARLKKEGFSGLRGESQKSKSEDEELESVRTDTRPGQRTLGFHSNHSQESTQEIIPAAHGMDAGLEATTFQMKVL